MSSSSESGTAVDSDSLREASRRLQARFGTVDPTTGRTGLAALLNGPEKWNAIVRVKSFAQVCNDCTIR